MPHLYDKHVCIILSYLVYVYVLFYVFVCLHAAFVRNRSMMVIGQQKPVIPDQSISMTFANRLLS